MCNSVLKIELQLEYKLGQCQNECAREAGECPHLSHAEFTHGNILEIREIREKMETMQHLKLNEAMLGRD